MKQDTSNYIEKNEGSLKYFDPLKLLNETFLIPPKSKLLRKQKFILKVFTSLLTTDYVAH